MKNRRAKILWYAEHHRAAGKAHQMRLISRHQRRRERWTIKERRTKNQEQGT